jgi:PAS domain S-box-containing protein
MRDEAEIVKELKELEKSGSLNLNNHRHNKSIDDFEDLDFKSGKKTTNNCYFDKSLKFKDLNGELYQKLVENSLEGILIVDFKGKILFSNPAFLNIFGYKIIDEVIGKNFFDFIHPDYRNKLIKYQKLLFIGKNGMINTYKALSSNGNQIWIEGIGYKINFLDEVALAVFIRDITNRQKTWYELVKLGDKYKALADMSTDSILIIDNLGRIMYNNYSFEKISGKNKNQINGILFRDFLSKNSIYQFQEIFIGARKTGKKIKDIELEFIDEKNNIIPIEISLSPLKNINNDFSGMACTIHDISLHKKIENELKKSKKLKTEFMNIAAHELKSPITPIKGYLDLIISDTRSNHNAKKWGKISLRNTERLLNLVNDILDVSRLDSDTMSFNMEKINPIDLLSDAVEDFEQILKKKKISLIKKFPNKLPFIIGDKQRFEQVIKNILSNAMKFTDKGKIVIEANEIDDKLLISIEDTGIGISKNDINKIFSKFYQSYTGNDRKCEGTGLGLFICKEIIKKHNGEIWAKSRLGYGSKFFIEIPVI